MRDRKQQAAGDFLTIRFYGADRVQTSTSETTAHVFWHGCEDSPRLRAADELHELVDRVVVHWDEEAQGHWLSIEGNLLEMLRKSAPRELSAVRGDAIFAKFGCGSRI